MAKFLHILGLILISVVQYFLCRRFPALTFTIGPTRTIFWSISVFLLITYAIDGSLESDEYQRNLLVLSKYIDIYCGWFVFAVDWLQHSVIMLIIVMIDVIINNVVHSDDSLYKYGQTSTLCVQISLVVIFIQYFFFIAMTELFLKDHLIRLQHKQLKLAMKKIPSGVIAVEVKKPALPKLANTADLKHRSEEDKQETPTSYSVHFSNEKADELLKPIITMDDVADYSKVDFMDQRFQVVMGQSKS